ncbi:glutamine amidotransferase-related protein [Devosia nitrariae]|uniref:Glutamine amidotransferase n=1 Tax=Devosia nitrariae TaxID=2071872 RepID=A0ABQ5W3T5_9HYPH|nr:gamma-glutamyl-gamma-aminobutyrate hydrolase family protein [Devosia nitrariae]GLQ54718.1 glutamine amidotransferase [Devosia nitrariae]
MKLTIIQTGEVPEPLRPRFGPYARMFERMFDLTCNGFAYETVRITEGEPVPEAASLDGIVITGSAAGVYDDYDWLDPLRTFIRSAYAARTPMLGVCFGHQIMADALGGDVRKSEKGWGLGRHTYAVKGRPAFMDTAPEALAVACSHQDQVIVAPREAEVILSSDFTPNAGLAYRNGVALSFQPHPEFLDDYTVHLAELRRGRAPDEVVDAAVASIATPSDSAAVAGYIGRFFKGEGAF